MIMHCSNRLMPFGSALSLMPSKLQQAIIPFFALINLVHFVQFVFGAEIDLIHLAQIIGIK